MHSAGRVHVEKAHLAYDGGAHEIAGTFARELREGFEKAAGGEGGGKLGRFCLRVRWHARPLAEIISAVDGDPRFDALETVEHEVAIYSEIARHGKLRKWLERNGLV